MSTSIKEETQGLETNYAGAPDEGSNESESNEQAVAQVVEGQASGGEVDAETQELANDPDIVSKENATVDAHNDVKKIVEIAEPGKEAREFDKAAQELGGGFVGEETVPNPEASNLVQFRPKNDTQTEKSNLNEIFPGVIEARKLNNPETNGPIANQIEEKRRDKIKDFRAWMQKKLLGGTKEKAA